MSRLTIHLGNFCPYCTVKMMGPIGGKRYPSRDHIIPKHLGNRPRRQRVTVVVCIDCNNERGSMAFRYFLRHVVHISEQVFWARVKENDKIVEGKRNATLEKDGLG